VNLEDIVEMQTLIFSYNEYDGEIAALSPLLANNFG